MIYSIAEATTPNIIMEGQQAEEYKKRKAKEAEEESLKYKRQASRRYPGPANNWKDNYGNSYTHQNPSCRKDFEAAMSGDEKAIDRSIDRYDDDSRRMSKSSFIGNKDYYSGKRSMNSEENARANDTVNRHIRRHPDQYKECGIFSNINFI